MLLFYDSLKRKSTVRKNTTKNKLSLGRVSLVRMEAAANKVCDKSHWSEKTKRKRLATGVKKKEKGIISQLGETKIFVMIKKSKEREMVN